MSVTPNISYFVYMTISLADRAGGASKEILISNRPLLDVDATDSDIEHWPILIGFNGLGSSMGKYIPGNTVGQITLDCSPDSMSSHRRIIDLFERYEPIGQVIEIYTKVAKVGALTDVTAGGTLLATSIVDSWKYRDGVLTMSVFSSPIESRPAGMTITSSAFPNAPQRSIGKNLPIVLGTFVEVKGYKVTVDSSPTFAIATTLSTEHPIDDVQNLKYNKGNKEYIDLENGSETAAIHGAAPVTHTAGNLTLIGQRAQSFVAEATGLVTNFEFYVDYTTTNPGATFKVKYWADLEGNPGVLLAEGAVPSTQNTGTGAQTMTGSLDTIFVMEEGVTYWASISGGTNMSVARHSGDSLAYVWDRNASNIEGWDSSLVQDYPYYFSLFGVRFELSDSSAGDVNGYGYASLEAIQQTAAAGQTNVDLNDYNLDIIAEIHGLQDDSSGSFTGVANQRIDEVGDALALLSQTWNGTTWGNAAISTTEYSTEIAAIENIVEPTGKSRGRTTLSKLINSICRSCGVRVGLRTGGLELYAEGTVQASKGRITDAEAKITEIQTLSANNAVSNVIKMNYDQKLSEVDATDSSDQGDLTTYAEFDVYKEDTSDYFGGLLANSQTIYGIREIGDIRFDFIKDSTHSEHLAKILAGKYREATILVTFEVPAIQFSTLDIFDVYDLVHPDMPAHFGTSSNAKPETYAGGAVSKGGEEEKMAQPYRIQVESRRLVSRRGDTPIFKVVGRVLNAKELN